MALALDPAVAHNRVARPRAIVVVVFDELPLTSLLGPGGRIDAGRYPSFAALAHTANWYRGATAVHDSTALAVPAMLDGRYPRRGLRSDVISHPVNLFTLLADKYEVNASEEATGLCPTSLCKPLAGTALSHLGGGKVRRFREFVRSIEPGERPTLWFKHVLFPHVPWQFYPSGRHYRRHAPEPIPGLNGPEGFGNPWLVKVSYQRHLLQLGLADRLLGELLGRLRRLGLFRDALVVVVADHGIGFHVGVERRTVTRGERGGCRAGSAAREAAEAAPRPHHRHACRDDQRAADDPRGRARADQAGDGRPLAASPGFRTGGPRQDLPPHRDHSQHDRRRVQLRPGRPGAAAPGGGAPQAGSLRKRERPRAALPDRPAPGARGPASGLSPAARRGGSRRDPPGGGAARTSTRAPASSLGR